VKICRCTALRCQNVAAQLTEPQNVAARLSMFQAGVPANVSGRRALVALKCSCKAQLCL